MNKKILTSAVLGVAGLALASTIPASAVDPKTADIHVTISESLTLTLSNSNINLALGDGTLKTDAITVSGSTNSAAGYKISVRAKETYTYLKHASTSVTENIPAISGSIAKASFPTNGWGYSADANTFKGITTSDVVLFSTTANGTTNHTFTAGVRTPASTVAGDYSNGVVFSIVANPTN